MAYYPGGYFPTGSASATPPVATGCQDANSYPLDFNPEYFRAAVYGNPLREQVRWWQAELDPAYDDTSAVTSAALPSKYLRVERVVSAYRVVVRNSKVALKFFPFGAIKDSDILLTAMPDEIPLGDHDLISPTGRGDEATCPVTSATALSRTIEYKEVLKRGEFEISQAGTLSGTGNTVTLSGGVFTSIVQVGDIIKSANNKMVVSAIVSSTQLTIVTALITPFTGNKWSLCAEKVKFSPVSALRLVRDASQVYTPTTHCTVSSAGIVRWSSTTIAPPFGTRYSVSYSVLPIYIVQYDLGVQRLSSGRPISVVARLYSHDGMLVR